MRRYVTDKQDSERIDDEDCWGMNYTGPTKEIISKYSYHRRAFWCTGARTPK